MKHTFYRATLRVLCTVAQVVAMTACTTGGSKYIVKTGDIYIVAGAYAGATTKVEYESTDSVHRTVWSEAGEEIYVAAYADGSRVDADGRLWSHFDQTPNDNGFDKEYMLFSGSALTPSTTEIASEQRLYALYPADALCDVQHDTVLVPSTQTYRPDSFDTEAVILVSAPLAVTLPSEGTAYTSAFRFRHQTGYIHLAFRGLPDEVAAERITRITLQTTNGTPIAGKYFAHIDNHAGDWTFTPADDASNRIELDFSGREVTVADLADCWFVMMPGDYGDVIVTIHTDSHLAIVMQRSGLKLESGAIDSRTIEFGDGDQIKRPTVITLTGSDLGFKTTTSTDETKRDKDGVTFAYKQVKRNGSYHIVFQNASAGIGGNLHNSTSLPGAIISIEINYAATGIGNGYIVTKLGDSLENYIHEYSGNKNEILQVVTPPAGEDLRYFCIENTYRDSGTTAIQSIKLTCAAD